MKLIRMFLTLLLVMATCWFIISIVDRAGHVYSCHCTPCLEETFETVDDLQKAVDAVVSPHATVTLLRRPLFGSATRLYRTAWEYIEAKDGLEGAQEFVDAIEENIRSGAHLDDLAAITAAIRYAENGGAGREYGALSAYAEDKTYRKQAGECAFSVQANWDRYLKGSPCLNQINMGTCVFKHKPGDSRDVYSFIDYQGHVYCPHGASNDPDGFNTHWNKNVRYHYEVILSLSGSK